MHSFFQYLQSQPLPHQERDRSNIGNLCDIHVSSEVISDLCRLWWVTYLISDLCALGSLDCSCDYPSPDPPPQAEDDP